jgi:glycosyltransferase involved in cell wall biosynthesis
MRSELGVDARILFIGSAGISRVVLDGLGIPFRELGLARGRSVLARPRLAASILADFDSEVAFLGYGGYLAAAFRLGGYSGTLVSVEHGGVLQVPRWTLRKKYKEMASRGFGERMLDGTICVSGLVESIVLGRIHAESVRVIYNGVDIERYSPLVSSMRSGCVFGHAGRLIEGKGVLNCIRALDRDLVSAGCRLLIAGDGPARHDAEALALALGVSEAVEFCGVVSDMPEFWRRCDVVVHPTTEEWKESFCLAVAEGMATGLPAIVSNVGALPEIVLDGKTGTVIGGGDVDGLRHAMIQYLEDVELRRRHGDSARARAVASFDIRRAAREYVEYANYLR